MHALYLPVILLVALVSGAGAQTLSLSASVIRCACGNAPSWAANANLRGYWQHNERGSLGTSAEPKRDSSPYDQDLTAGGGVVEGPTYDFCYAHLQSSTSTGPGCGTGCTDTDFFFPAQSFTVGCWTKPTSYVHFGAYKTTDNFNGNFGEGWTVGWTQADASSGNYVFKVDTAADGEVKITSAISYSFPIAWHHHLGEFTQGGAGGTLRQYIDTVLDANTTTTSADLTSGDGLAWGQASASLALGKFDECFAYAGILTAEDKCRIAVCGWDGCACDCDGASYTRAALHTSFGGPLTCTLPACDKAAPD